VNFNQWRNYAAKGDVSKITYICGDQPTLVELVLDDIKNILNVPVTDYLSVDASQAANVWDIASQYPLDPEGNRLTVVRNADRFSDWPELAAWLGVSRNNPKNFLVFISAQADAPAIFDKGKKTSYASHIELIRSKGKFIKCSKPNDEDLVKWCESYGLSPESAQFVVERTSGDVASILSVLKKVKVWKGSPNKNALALFCKEQALDSMADYLILGEKRAALLALEEVKPEDYSRIISRLDMRLDYMLDINRCVIRRMYANDISQMTGIKIYLVNKFKGVAKEYDFAKVKQRRQVITLIDSHLRSGAKTGLMEALVALW
jgi:DNA polymerase III delta subunit